MSKSKFEISKESGPHRRMAGLVGSWDGLTRTWFEKDVLADESPMRGRMALILDGRFLSYEYVAKSTASLLKGKCFGVTTCKTRNANPAG